ncbi:TRAP transporter substrate-binding protein [Nocardioides sambongensis]|uniref:TRAP transporter substrate-binding protein n=1 Tax=Nocardioides sambongensis TaxID=2589074 RepID=UPI001125D0C8|nr:TRAP transporter substrate-binding protein [Nocardioides sambongensis]
MNQKSGPRGSTHRRGTLKTAGILSAFVLASATLAACGGDDGGSGGDGEKLTFRLAETHPEDYPTTEGDQKFADLVNEASDGRIDIQVFAGGQLGEESDVIEQVQMGAIEMTRVSSAPMTEFAEGMGLFGLPYIWDDADHLWRFLEDESGQQLLGELEEAGFKGLTYFDPGARSFYSTDKVIDSVDDIEGMKFRVQESDVIISFIEALGGSPTPMDYGEVYSALQTGLIDGAENNEPSYLSASHYEVAPNYTLDEHMRVAEILVVNKDVWDGLSEEDQQILEDAAAEATTYQREQWDAQVEEDLAALEEADVTITEIDDIEPWREAAQPVIDEFGPTYQEYLDRIEELREE